MACYLLLILVIFFTTITSVLPCKPATPVETYTPAQTFEAAPIIIQGTYVRDYIGDPVGEAPPHTSKHVIVSVNCTIKSGNVSVPNNLTLNGNYMWSSCFHSELEPGTSYIMALERVEDDPQGFFRVFEANVASVGTYEPSEGNIETAQRYCGEENLGADVCYFCHNVTVSGDETSAVRKSTAFLPTILVLLLMVFILQ